MEAMVKVAPCNRDAVAWGLLKKLQLTQVGDVREASLTHGMTVLLEDNGQDFLEFDIKDGSIIATRPFQGWVWDGTRVINDIVSPGVRLVLLRKSSGVQMTLFHRVIGISPLFENKG